VTDAIQRELERANRELGAARGLIDLGYPEKAVSSCYYAVFHAATAALLVLGETRSKQSGVSSAFGHLIVQRAGFDRETGSVLNRLFERRNDVDYGLEYPSREQAAAETDDAERFVSAVERWIEDQRR
jgi:uncharacterized protein (UPF0332 family)